MMNLLTKGIRELVMMYLSQQMLLLFQGLKLVMVL